MARPRREVPARRYQLTLDRPVADRLEAYADAVRRPTATAASDLLTNALTRLDTPEDAELREARRQVEELTARVQALRRQLAQRVAGDKIEPPAPRWEWSMDVLLADTEWWDHWLPRLNELLGRRLGHLVPEPRRPAHGQRMHPPTSPADERGYSNLLGFLFPAIVTGTTTLTWRSPDYPAAARREDTGSADDLAAPTRAQVWEPVIRHVAEALCALESTGQADVDPYLRLRAEAEITGPWTRILRYLLGEEEPELPRRRLA